MLIQFNKVAAIDVHKRILHVVALQRESPDTPLAQSKFTTTRSGLDELHRWLGAHGVEAVVMESTAQYWWPIWIDLEQQWALFLAQAQSNAAPHGRKTDFRDAVRLGRRFFSGDLRFSFVPKPAQRIWRRLARTYRSLGEQIVEARNEVEALLEEGQIKLSCVVSDLLGVSGLRILNALAKGETGAENLAKLSDSRIRATKGQQADALHGKLSVAHRLVLQQHLDRIELMMKQRAELQKHLETTMEEHAPAVRRLVDVPGIRIVGAQHLIAEIGHDVAAFPSPGHLASWVGVCPGRKESAGVSTSNRCAKGNRFVRCLLSQMAHAAARTKGTFWEALFKKLQPRLGVKKALWAIAHRLLRLIWKILAEGVTYQERGAGITDPVCLRRRMLRLQKEFLHHGFEIQFTPSKA